MNNFVKLAAKYARYYLTADTKHQVHSPFIFDLVTKVLEDTRVHPAYHKVEALRHQLLADRSRITVEDFGAGGEKSPVKELVISDIANKAAKPAKYGKLLYRLCNYFQPQNILELGTSLGITTCYQALGALERNPSVKFVTCEGAPALIERAKENFRGLGIDSYIHAVTGDFDQTLPSALEQFDKLDYVLFDGNHRYEPTVQYFEKCLPLVHNDTLFVIDDIYWSEEMTEAWNYIKAHPAVTVTVDLFFIGLVFFRREQVRQDFVIRF